jgi:hypothetical protein
MSSDDYLQIGQKALQTDEVIDASCERAERVDIGHELLLLQQAKRLLKPHRKQIEGVG